MYLYVYTHIDNNNNNNNNSNTNNHTDNTYYYLEQHKPGRIKPGRIKRAALSLQNQNGYTFDVCRVKHPGTKQLPIHISGAGFNADLQIWLLGTTPFDTTPFICL